MSKYRVRERTFGRNVAFVNRELTMRLSEIAYRLSEAQDSLAPVLRITLYSALEALAIQLYQQEQGTHMVNMLADASVGSFDFSAVFSWNALSNEEKESFRRKALESYSEWDRLAESIDIEH